MVVSKPQRRHLATKQYTTSYYSGILCYYTEKAENYTSSYATPVYYTEEFKCYCAPRNDRMHFTTPPTPPSVKTSTYDAHNFIEAPKYYTIKAQPIHNQG